MGTGKPTWAVLPSVRPSIPRTIVPSTKTALKGDLPETLDATRMPRPLGGRRLRSCMVTQPISSFDSALSLFKWAEHSRLAITVQSIHPIASGVLTGTDGWLEVPREG